MTDEKTVIWRTYDGVALYAKLFEENRDMGGPLNERTQRIAEEEGNYTIDLIVDDVTKAKMIHDGIPETTLGYQMFHPTEDGWKYKLRRPHVSLRLRDDAGEPLVLGPPLVLDWNKSVEEKIPVKWGEETLIGDGSKVKVNVQIWKGPKGRRIIRLDGVYVVELVEYTPGETTGIDWKAV